MYVLLSCLLVFLFLFCLVNALLWFYLSASPFSGRALSPGEPYEVDGRFYVMPNLPIEGQATLLKAEYVRSLRTLFQQATGLLDSLGVDWHVTGGTLLGAVRHNAVPMPFDDDIDIAVPNEKREFLYSGEFVEATWKWGLKVLYFANSSAQAAGKIGSAVRLQNADGPFANGCTLDIFFWASTAPGYVSKLDGWDEYGLVPSQREVFPAHAVYPLQKEVQVDGLALNMPREPAAVLAQQYSRRVFNEVVTRPQLISHFYPFYVFGWCFPSRPMSFGVK